MGIWNKIFNKKKSLVKQVEFLATETARQQEKEFISSLLKLETFKDNYEIDCLAQILINETDFLIESDRIPTK